MRMMPDTEALVTNYEKKYSCTVVIGETVLFFGGEPLSRQISQLTPIGLFRIGTLPFAFERGTCLVTDSQLMLGFDWYHRNSCWSRLAFLNCEFFKFDFSSNLTIFDRTETRIKHHAGKLVKTITKHW